jgi:hypothetical protein
MVDNTPAVVDQPKKGFAGKDYNHVAMGSKLRAISLLKTEFNVNADCLAEKDKWKLSYDWHPLACKYGRKGRVSAIFQYVVIAKLGRKTAVRCAAEYIVLYAVPQDSDAEAAEGFCHNVGFFAAYPYFRALVAQLASSANILLPPLPSMASTAHIPKNKDKQNA